MGAARMLGSTREEFLKKKSLWRTSKRLEN